MAASEAKEKQISEKNGHTKDEEPEETNLIVPPDGGWGWVVVVASFVCCVLVDGMVFSCGLLLDPMNESFKESKAKMAFVSSLLSGFYLIAGPFVSALANRFGFRKVTMIGSMFASLCLGVSYFSNGVLFLYIVYGVLGGIGLSTIYIPAVIVVGFYFEKWRALATGISMCGSGVGTFLFAPLSTYFISQYGWRGTLLINSGLILICMISGFMFRPLKPTKVKVDNDNNANFEKNNKEAVDKLSNLLKTQPDLGTSSTPHTWMGVAPNTTYPTAIEVFRKSQTNLEMRRSSASATVLKNQLQTNGHNKPPKFIAVTVTEKEEDGNEASTAQPLLNEENGDGERRHTMSGRNPRSRRGTLTEESQVVRPLYREDIFFAGSLKKIPQYNSRTSVGYHMSVTHLPTVQDVAEETDATCTLCPEAVTRTLATMLDFSLLKSPSFLLLAFSGFFSMLGFFVPIIYAPARAITSGMNENNAMWIVSIIGIANTVGRVLCGLCSSFDGIDALWINNVAITLGGIATMFSGISSSMAFTYTYCVIFGISIACFASLRTIIVVELMGLEKLTNAFGLLMMFQGIATIIGAPIAGVFMDLTGSYDVSFYIAGGLYTFSGLLCFPLRYVAKWEKSRSSTHNKKAGII